MKTGSDQELLREYAQAGSETAFAELVRRHVDAVFSAAVRLLVDRHQAEDAVQQVFVALAQNARKLSGRPVISGWLHRTTHNFAVMIIRREERRRAREEKASTMAETETPFYSNEDIPWARIGPHLDQALARLPEADQDAIALRFFDRKTAAEIGQILGVTEEAAQKRLNRAVARLRQTLMARGVSVSASSLTALVGVHAVQSAPAHLAAGVAAKVLAGISSGATAGGGGMLNWLTSLKAHPIAATVVGLAVVSLGTGGYLTGQASARQHWQSVRWQRALSPSSEAIAVPPQSTVRPSAALATPAPAVSAHPAARSVAQLLAEAAEHFRGREDHPDGWATGFVLMSELAPEDAPEALRLLAQYRDEPTVFRAMAPLIVKAWAELEPRAALDYALQNLQDNGLGMSIEYVTRAWSKQEPLAAWEWYRQTTEAGQPPIIQGSWMWVPKHIFGEWAAHDPAQAIAYLQEIPYGDRDNAIFGIANAAQEPALRPGIVDAISRMSDEIGKGELSRRVATKWARLDPPAAAEWTASLTFENPVWKLGAMGEVAEEWWPMDPHATSRWLLENAPAEMMDQVYAAIKRMTNKAN